LLSESNKQLSFKKTSFLWAISEVKRYIPGKLWFVLGRTVAFSDLGFKKKEIGRLIIIELEIFALSALVVSLLSLPFISIYYGERFPFINNTNIIVLIIFVVFLLWFYIYNQKISFKFPDRIRRLSEAILPTNKPGHIAFLLFISALSLLFYGLANYLIISSFIFINPQFLPQLTGFFTLSFLIGFLSFITPSGLGVREGIMAFGLGNILAAGPAAFASLFARIMLIISEIVFLMISALWIRLKNRKIQRLESIIHAYPQESVLAGLVLMYIIYFTLVSFLRYDNFYTGRFDLGNMVQTVWNTTQGRIFIFTNPNGTEIVSRLAFHADFILILLAPFYYLWSSPKVLLLLQTIFVGCGAFFIYAIGKKVLKNKNLALAFSLAYLLNPSIQRANIYDFHAVTLATFFLLGAYYFYLKKKYLSFSIAALLAALTKEQIWLIIAIFGVFMIFVKRKKVFGAFVLLMSLFMFYFLIWHAIPSAYGSEHFALSYFSEFGSSPGDVVKNIILSPDKTLARILTPSRIDYLKQLFLPVGFLAVLSPFSMIFALPDLLINLLSRNSQLHQIYYQYTAAISPFIFAGAMMGAEKIKKVFKLPNRYLITYIIIMSTLGAYFYGPLPGAVDSNLEMFTHPVAERNSIQEYIASIPESASVTASNNIGSHLSEREKIYTLPKGLEEAEYAVFLLTNRSSIIKEKEMIEKLRNNSNYYNIVENDNLVIFRKIEL
jgi:uncharacterized membrane protein/uncharacterized membrane protein YbhN (UPF0104 family)